MSFPPGQAREITDPEAEVDRLAALRSVTGQQDVNAKAAAFAKLHGSFSLAFDASQNYVAPDDCPWSLILDSDESKGWGGFTAGEAIDFAATELGGAGEPS